MRICSSNWVWAYILYTCTHAKVSEQLNWGSQLLDDLGTGRGFRVHKLPNFLSVPWFKVQCDCEESSYHLHFVLVLYFCVCEFYVHEFHTFAIWRIGHVSKFLCVFFLNVALHRWNSSYQPSIFLYILQCIVFRCQYVVSCFSLLQQCYIPIVCCKVLLYQLSRMISTHLFHFFRMSFMPLEP
jgi:hypothetical protein